MSVRDDAISAHGGGELVDLKAPAGERATLAVRAAKLPAVPGTPVFLTQSQATDAATYLAANWAKAVS